LRHSIRSKLILYAVLPVIAVYAFLFWLGVSHVRDQLSRQAQDWLIEHARYQASRLALLLSQVPVLAESLADLVLANPEQPQALLYAHLIDGLRRTPIAEATAVSYGQPARSALMRRGSPAGQELTSAAVRIHKRGWQQAGEALLFSRPIQRRGEVIGESWVELPIANIYREMARRNSPSVLLFVSHEDGGLLQTGAVAPEVRALATRLPAATEQVTVRSGSDPVLASAYWLVSTELPGLPLRLTAATPRATALAPARREAAAVAGVLLLSLFAIVLIIALTARRITRPLEVLDSRVQQIAGGNFALAPETAPDDELGRLAAAIARMARHIADREAQLRKSHQDLELRVAERTAALKDSNARLIRQIEATRDKEEALRLANTRAQQASRAKSEFLSNMSHELRTPLHGVLGYAQILRRDPELSAAQREHLESIERCGQHLLTLINDILDMAKIEAGRMQVESQPTDLRQLLEDVRMIVAQRAAHKGLSLSVELDPGLPTVVLTDGVKLKQILLNLLGNAVKFTNRGAVSLRAKADGMLAFEVADTGVGIPAQKIDSIFDAFEQVREGQAVDGTGLGLAINQRLISLLGGEAMQVESTPGTGSRFRFRIPYQPAPPGLLWAAPASAGATLVGPPAAGRPWSALVVDAQAEGRDLLATLLRDAHGDVESLGRHDEAVQRLRERAFDLVLFDLRLTHATAPELAAALRQAALGAPCLVAVSASVFDGAERRARDAGFDDFLPKPFGSAQLFALLERVLGEQSGPADRGLSQWPQPLAGSTAQRILAAVELGDAGSLFQLAEELADDPAAPSADVEQMALMARLFDFDGLRALAGRLAQTVDEPDSPA
jgi:signal transduction histidine kinase/DNA-binding response OmpR family regulator